MLQDNAFKSFEFFSQLEKEQLYDHLNHRMLSKNEYLLNAGEVCRSLYYVNRGAIYQYNYKDEKENIHDLHIEGEWIVNQKSFITQCASKYSIKAYEKTEVYELTVYSLHQLIVKSPIYLSIGKLLEQGDLYKLFIEESYTPKQKYEYILKNKPVLLQKFPLKMIASYLKISPETISRVRNFIS